MRTKMASYVQYTYFKVAVSFLKWGIPKTYSLEIWDIPVWLHPCKIFAVYRGKKHRK